MRQPKRDSTPFALDAAESIARINPNYTATVTELGAGGRRAYVVRHGARCYVCIPHGRASEGVTIYGPGCAWLAERNRQVNDADHLEPILAAIRAEVRV